MVKPDKRRISVPFTTDRIEALLRMNIGALKQEWQRVYGSPAPRRLSRDLLQRAVAYRIQELAFGGLDRQSQKQLSMGMNRNKEGPTRPSKTLSPTVGTRLIREWNGATHQVEAIENGYLYQGTRFKSLSQIARHITGTRWSGPLFFGLKPVRKVSTHGS